MPYYKVTLNFTFTTEIQDLGDLKHDGWEYEEYGEPSEDRPLKGKEGETKEQVFERKKQAFARTMAYYQEHDVVEYIQEVPAMDFIGELMLDHKVLTAEWIPGEFQMEIVLRSEMEALDLANDLRNQALEDCLYGKGYEYGWELFTRGPGGETLAYGDSMSDFWFYGLVDYRWNEIRVEEDENYERCAGCGTWYPEGEMDSCPGYGNYCTRACGPAGYGRDYWRD